MLEHYPSSSAADKQAKADLISQFFKTKSWTEVSKKIPLHELRENYNSMHIHLNGVSSKYFPPIDEIDDCIPNFETKDIEDIEKRIAEDAA